MFSIPLNTFTANILKNLQLKQMKSRDKRTKMMSELLNNIKRLALFFVSLPSDLPPRSIKLYAWDYSFMSRVMAVRNDEELKNLRSIGIVGVRHQKHYFRIEPTNNIHFQAVNFSLWSGIPCKPVASSICDPLLTNSSSPCRVQLLRHCGVYFSNTSDGRDYLPSHLTVYASAVPTWDGESSLLRSSALVLILLLVCDGRL